MNIFETDLSRIENEVEGEVIVTKWAAMIVNDSFEVEISACEEVGRISVYRVRGGLSGLSAGKHFSTWEEALGSYKSDAMKAAIEHAREAFKTL